VTARERFVEKKKIVTTFLDGIGNLDFDTAGEHLADDAVMVLPFVEVAAVQGKSAIVHQLRNSIPQMFDRMDFAYDEWYDVRNPDVLVVEYHSECPQKGTSGTYRNRYITVFRFDDDKISLYKEYLNPMELIAAMTPG
jgi:ketosteroid isomerase-like protein